MMSITARLFRGRVKARDTGTPGYQAHRGKVNAPAFTTDRPIPTCKRHKCTARHRTYTAMARCIYGGLRIYGQGAYVTFSRTDEYGPHSVHLHQTEEAARKAYSGIDDTECGGGCNRSNMDGHIVRLELPGRK